MNSDQQTHAPIILATSSLVIECEITFTSYEDIKRELNNYIGDKVISKELPDSYVVNGRLNLYMITPFLDDPIKFMVSAYTYDKVRYGCSFWNCIEYEHEVLCEYLDRIYEVKFQHHNLEEVDFIVPADHLLAYTEIVNNFSSPELVKDALQHAINCSYNQRTYDNPSYDDEPFVTKEVPDSCILIRPFVNEPTKFMIYLYQPKNDVYISTEFTSANLIYYLEDYRNWFEANKDELSNVPADSVFIDEEIVIGFNSREDVKSALNNAIHFCNTNPYSYKEKELVESWFVIKPLINNPKNFIERKKK
jgi:hypothetical protein